MYFIIFALMNTIDVKTRMANTLRRVLEEQARKNLPHVYRDASCISKSQFIHLYPDGKKVLIQQNRATSEEKVIKEF